MNSIKNYNNIIICDDCDQYLIKDLYRLKDYKSVVAISITCPKFYKICNDCAYENGIKKTLKDRLMEEYFIVRHATIIYYSLMEKNKQISFDDEVQLSDDLYSSPLQHIKDRGSLLELSNGEQSQNEIVEILNFVEIFVKKQYNQLKEEYIALLKENITCLLCSDQMIRAVFYFLDNNNKLKVCKDIIEVAKKAFEQAGFNNEDSDNSRNNAKQRELLEKIVSFDIKFE